MIIDAHVHIWHRNWLPDQAVKLYLEPARKLKELGLDDVFEFGLDDEIPFSDYDTPMEEYVRGLDANHIDRMIVLGIDFGLVNEGRMTIDDYFQWLYDKCSVDDRFMIFIGVDPNRRMPSKSWTGSTGSTSPRGSRCIPPPDSIPTIPSTIRSGTQWTTWASWSQRIAAWRSHPSMRSTAIPR